MTRDQSRDTSPLPSPRHGRRGAARPASEIDAFLADVRSRAATACGGRSRTAAVRHGRHHEPAADVGPGAGLPGGDVSRNGAHRRPRCSARLLSRLRRMPGLEVGERPHCPGAAHDRHRLPRRQHADRQGAGPCQTRRRPGKRSMPAVLVGDAFEESIDDGLCRGRRDRPPRHAHVHVSRRPRSHGGAGVPRDRAPDQGRLLPARCRVGGPASRTPFGGRGLCGRRPASARRLRPVARRATPRCCSSR